MAVEVKTEPKLSVSTPTPVVKGDYYRRGQVPTYDVHPDGRFLMIKEADAQQAAPGLQMVVNWFEELKRLAPLPEAD